MDSKSAKNLSLNTLVAEDEFEIRKIARLKFILDLKFNPSSSNVHFYQRR